MKVKVTVSGEMELEPMDVKLLRKAGGPEAMDTMKFHAATLDVKVETVKAKKTKEAAEPVLGDLARTVETTANTSDQEEPGEPMPDLTGEEEG